MVKKKNKFNKKLSEIGCLEKFLYTSPKVAELSFETDNYGMFSNGMLVQGTTNNYGMTSYKEMSFPWTRDNPCVICNLEVYLIDSISLVQTKEQKILSGKGYINEKYTQNICHNCKRLYEAVTEITSSQLGLILCEKCGSIQKTKSNITKISRTNREFEFEVYIECENCSKKNRRVKKILNFLKKFKYELNLGGIFKVKRE